MKKRLILFSLLLLFSSCDVKEIKHNNHENGQNLNRIEVLTLGTFHFGFPNRDVQKVKKKEMIDVLETKYQKEIDLIVDKITKFNPTKIVVEVQSKNQKYIDSLYQSYLKGEYKLKRDEVDQIGFRLAKKLGLKKLYCVDEWGKDYEYITEFLEDKSERKKFLDYFYHNPDSLLNLHKNEKKLYKEKGILAELKRINSKEYLEKSLGNYFIGVFKYETSKNKYFGADFTTG